MISKIRYTEEGGLYTQLDGEPTDIEYNNAERLIILKLNEVISELNKLSKSLQYDGSTIQKDDKSIQFPFETRVGMLRQWLNEDRITEPDRMVTNEQIMVWLKKEDVTPEPSQQVQNVTQGDSLCNPKEVE